MENDVLVDFYLASVKVQSHEFHLCGSKLSDDYASALLRETEIVRRDLGAAMCRLLHSALPSFMRNPRLFRTKYTEEVDLRNLEKCLVAAANKVVTFNPLAAPRDYDLRPAQPSAIRFLDVLTQVQCLVSNLIELALASCDRQALKKQKVQENRGLCASTDCVRIPEKRKSIERRHTMDSLTVKPAMLRIRRHSRSAKDSGDKKRRSTGSPQASTSQCTPISKASSSTGYTVEVEVRIGPNVYREAVRLPPTSMLVISDELCKRLVELDETAAQFEFEFVRVLSRRLRTVQEAEDLQLMAVLFSETLMWGMAVRLFTVRQLADRDPTVLLSLPRLAILVGTRILPDSPIGAHRLAAGRRLPFMCAMSRADLAYLARQLHALRLDQLFRLARWLGPRGLPNLNRSRSSQPTMSGSSPRQIDSQPLSPSPNPGLGMQSSWCGSLSPPLSRRTWKANLAGLHRIYKSIATVADRFTRDYPTELRFILQAVIEMHDTSEQEAALNAQAADLKPVTSAQQEQQEEQTTNQVTADSQSASSSESSSSESNETELEDELIVDEKALGSDPKYGSLAKLLDWSDVISHREDNKTRLTALLRSSTGSALKWAKSEDSLMLPDMPQSDRCSVKKPSVTGEAHASMMELGVDVAAMLTEGEIVATPAASCDQSGSETSDLSALRSYLNASNDLSENDSSGSGLLAYRLHKLNLGSSVEGIQTATDQVLHYLPAWQPDRLVEHQRSYLGETDSETDDRGTDSDERQDDDEEIVYQVGRQCASCLRAFTLFRRRHHCRRCGHIFCASCCNHWQTVEGLATSKAVRICSECHEFLNNQST